MSVMHYFTARTEKRKFMFAYFISRNIILVACIYVFKKSIQCILVFQ